MHMTSFSLLTRVKSSRFDTAVVPKRIKRAVSRAGVELFVVEDGDSCYFGGIILVSIRQALILCQSYGINLDQSIESIICHNLGHHLMDVAGIPQPPNPYTERLAWLLGRQFIGLTTIPSHTYTLITIKETNATR